MEFVARVQSQYNYLSPQDVMRIVDKAKAFYYELRYPCDLSKDEQSAPIKSFREKMWVLEACDEIIERLGFSSALGYKENGIAWTFDGAKLSDRLVNMIVPQAFVIGK